MKVCLFAWLFFFFSIPSFLTTLSVSLYSHGNKHFRSPKAAFYTIIYFWGLIKIQQRVRAFKPLRVFSLVGDNTPSSLIPMNRITADNLLLLQFGDEHSPFLHLTRHPHSL